jgi:excisionase family DNA binding protein
MRISVADVQHVAHVPYEDGETVSEQQAFVAGGLLTVAEVASAMRVSNMTVYRLIKSGELPAVRVGKNYRLRESDLERFLEDRSVRTEGP